MWTVVDELAQQMTAIAWVAGVFLADAQIVEAGGIEHLADFIDGPICVSGEQDGSVVRRQMLFHQIAQRHRRLARAGRADKEEVVESLTGAQHDVVVVWVIAARELLRGIGAWRLQAQQEPAPLWCSSSEGCKGLDVCATAKVAMFEGVEESPTPTLPRREGGRSATLVALHSRF